MYRIDNSTSANAPVPPPTPLGKPEGYFTGGNPATATPATVVDAEWLNMIQEEGANLVISAGLTLDKANRTQWSQAIDTKIATLPLPFVRIAGDTMTGSLVMTPGAAPGTPEFPGQMFLGNGVVLPIGTGIALNVYYNAAGAPLYHRAGFAGTLALETLDAAIVGRVLASGAQDADASAITAAAAVVFAANAARLMTPGFLEVWGPGVRYEPYGSSIIGMAWGGVPPLSFYIDGTRVGGITPAVAADEASATRSGPSAVDALAALEVIPLGEFDITLPNKDGAIETVTVPLGLMSSDDIATVAPPYLVRALQQLAARVTALESAGGV